MILREVQELIKYHSVYGPRFARHDCHNVFGKAMKDLAQFGFGGLEGKRVLDLGCGQRFPFALQCAASGADVTALDIDYVKPDSLPIAFYRTARFNGLKRACKSALRKVLFDGSYYAALDNAAGKPLRRFKREIKFVTADPAGAEYPLPGGSFDLIVSNAVLEHVADVNKFSREINRLLGNGGVFHGIIHNFYSLSGGHHMEWAYPEEEPG